MANGENWGKLGTAANWKKSNARDVNVYGYIYINLYIYIYRYIENTHARLWVCGKASK